MAMKIDVMCYLKHDSEHDLRLFDERFARETRSFADHLDRTYQNLQEICEVSTTQGRRHWFPAAVFLLDAATSLVSAFSLLRRGYPMQALDLGRRHVECCSMAVFLCDQTEQAAMESFRKLDPGACVSYAKRHLPNAGREYGFYSLFDHAKSAILNSYLVSPKAGHIAVQIGALSLADRELIFNLAALRLLAAAHNLEAVVEMLFFFGLRGEKRYWKEIAGSIEYSPIEAELQCENKTIDLLTQTNETLLKELDWTNKNEVEKQSNL